MILGRRGTAEANGKPGAPILVSLDNRSLSHRPFIYNARIFHLFQSRRMNNRSSRTELNDYSDKNVRNVNFSAARELTEHACLLYHLVRLTAGGGFRFIQNRDNTRL